MTGKRGSPFDRAMARLDTSDPQACWTWPGARSRGYGKIGTGNLSPLAVHRVVYEGLVGPIPEGMELDHLCRNRACANPAHLEPVTHRENGRRGMGAPGVNARKVECARGHAFDEANTRVTRDGTRTCRECHRQYEARRRAALRAAGHGHRSARIPVRGEKHGCARLTTEQVLRIRAARLDGVPCATLASEYAVSESLVSLIANGKLWAHVPAADAAREAVARG